MHCLWLRTNQEKQMNCSYKECKVGYSIFWWQCICRDGMARLLLVGGGEGWWGRRPTKLTLAATFVIFIWSWHSAISPFSSSTLNFIVIKESPMQFAKQFCKVYLMSEIQITTFKSQVCELFSYTVWPWTIRYPFSGFVPRDEKNLFILKCEHYSKVNIFPPIYIYIF